MLIAGRPIAGLGGSGLRNGALTICWGMGWINIVNTEKATAPETQSTDDPQLDNWKGIE